MFNFGLGIASWILGLPGVKESKAQGIIDLIRYLLVT